MNEAPVNGNGDFVLYWMIAFRRTQWNFSLQRAVEWCTTLNKPLVVLEALRCDYPWASERIHHFMLGGMADNRRAFERSAVLYYPYVERKVAEGKGLLEALGNHACVIVTDDFPAFFLPRMVAAAAKHLPVKLEKVDSNGILPLRATERTFATAYSFRRYIQGNLADHIWHAPVENPLSVVALPSLPALPAHITRRWPLASKQLLEGTPQSLKDLPIDHGVGIAPLNGGSQAAEKALEVFLREHLHRYATSRNHPDENATSGLSPYLHFGHVSPHLMFAQVSRQEDWSMGRLLHKASGHRAGWWGMSEGAEAFLDQFITWRELGFNMCSKNEGCDRFESLPEWAAKQLTKHAGDPRPYVYSQEQFESAATHDPLWNAAQNELLREGKIHNYLRMLWGKKILHWSASPREALQIMTQLNNKYALDGRDPNSYSGIFWILGRYDRPWGPERPVFGQIRYMSSKNTLRKLRVKEYLEKFNDPSPQAHRHGISF